MVSLAYETSVPASYRAAFIQKVKAISTRLGINPNWLMIVIRFESAGTFSPSVKNPNSAAYGLIQFTEKGVKGLGVTLDQIRQMDAVTQLDYVEKYLTPYRGKMTDLYNFYLAVFAPAYIGRPDAQKVYASPSSAYSANKLLDTNEDGVITVAEIKQVIKRYIPAGFEETAPTDNTLLYVVSALVLIIFLNQIIKQNA